MSKPSKLSRSFFLLKHTLKVVVLQYLQLLFISFCIFCNCFLDEDKQV